MLGKGFQAGIRIKAGVWSLNTERSRSFMLVNRFLAQIRVIVLVFGLLKHAKALKSSKKFSTVKIHTVIFNFSSKWMPIFIFSPKNNEKGNGSLRNRWKNPRNQNKECISWAYNKLRWLIVKMAKIVWLVMNSVLLGKVHAAYSKADFSKAAAEKWS